MNRKVLTGIAVGVATLFLVAWLASPILTVRGIVGAAEAGDAERLERLVDFPAFRDSVRDELSDRLVAEMRADPRSRDSALGGLGLMLAPTIVSGMVDVFVTPDAIVAMVQSAEAPDPVDDVRPRPQPEAEPAVDDDIRRTYGYRDLNTFVVTLTDPDNADEPLRLLLERRGLFGWKLAGIDLAPRPED